MDKQQSYFIIMIGLLSIIIIGSVVFSPFRGFPVDEIRVKITRYQALQVLRGSSQVDPNKDILKGSLISAELLVIQLNWTEYLRYTGDHNRIYISPTLTDTPRPYWVMEFETYLGRHNGNHGKYIVDAITGEVMLALEDYFGPPGPGDFEFSTAPNYLVMERGETKSVIVKIMARPTYNASLPIILKINKVPPGITVSSNATSALLRDKGIIIFVLTVTAAPDAKPIGGDAANIELDIESVTYITGTWIPVTIS